MLIGYARVSTIDQNTDLQTDALKQRAVRKYSLIKSVESNLTAPNSTN